MKVAPEAFTAALARRIRDLRRRYSKRLERCQRKFSPPAVHELRIATRQMLALTDLLESLTLGMSVHKIRRTFKRRLDAFDALRDTQVQRCRLVGFSEEFAVVRELDRWLKRQERKLIKQLLRDVKALRQDRIERWLKRAERNLKRMEAKENRGLLPKVSRALKTSFQLVTRLRRGARADRISAIHRLRIAFKHHRYLCELLQPLWPPLAVMNLKAMHRFQTLMGEIQDCEVMLAGIRDAVEGGAVEARAIVTLRKAVLLQRTRCIRSFLEKIERLWEFQPIG
jgi:CHAD domain-containing protein